MWRVNIHLRGNSTRAMGYNEYFLSREEAVISMHDYEIYDYISHGRETNWQRFVSEVERDD